MNNNLQLVLKSSTTEMSLNDHDAGIYIVPELDGLTGLPEIRTTSGVNAGYDGGWTSAQKFDARSIVIRGVIANDDKTEVERMRRELVALLAQGKNEQLELDFVTETGRAYEVQVRTIACDMAMQRVLTQQEFMITLRADDPLIYDNSSTGEEATVNISGATGGFRIPFEIPLAIDAGSEETVVQNSGLESVAPTIKMYGALHNPKIINHTTNQAMQVEAELGFTEGSWTTPVDAPEGTNVSFEPEREAPIESAKLKGDTTQQTYTGKNLCGIPDQTFNWQGVDVTIKNGEITMNGTSTGTGTKNISPIKTTILNGSYTTNLIYVSGTSGSGNFNLRKASDSTVIQGTQTSYAPSNSNVSYNISNTEVIFGLYILSVGSVFTNYKFKVQIVAGSTPDNDFEPYVGGVPAPNPDYPQAVNTVTGENVVKITDGQGADQSYEVNLGKNLFDKDTATLGYRIGSDGSPFADGSYFVSDYIQVSPNSKYEISPAGTTSDYGSSATAYYDSSKTFISRTVGISSGWQHISTPANCAYIRFTTNKIVIDSTQLEKGSQATSYAAYFEPIELCKIGTYQDSIYKSDGKWYKHKVVDKIVLTGSESNYMTRSNTSTTHSKFRISSNVLSAPIATTTSIRCTNFVANAGANAQAYSGNAICGSVAANFERQLWFSIDNTIASTVDAFKTWVTNNTPTVYYALATPTDTEITNEALVAQLEALVDGNAVVYEGETHIAVTAAEGNMPGITAIRYYTDKEPDQRDELIIDSRLKTITLNGLDVYHLKTEGSEFPMLAPGENRLSLQSDITGDNGYAKVSYKQGYLSI